MIFLKPEAELPAKVPVDPSSRRTVIERLWFRTESSEKEALQIIVISSSWDG